MLTCFETLCMTRTPIFRTTNGGRLLVRRSRPLLALAARRHQVLNDLHLDSPVHRSLALAHRRRRGVFHLPLRISESMQMTAASTWTVSAVLCSP